MGNMVNGGWVKLYRELKSKSIWQLSSPPQKVVLITILLLANHEENNWEWNGEQYVCKPGQLITSLNSLVRECGEGVTIRNVRTALDRFEKLGFLTNVSTKTGRLITVVNWEKYQGGGYVADKDSDKDLTKSRQRPDKDLTTNKNDKEYKNDKEEKNKNTLSADVQSVSEKWRSLGLKKQIRSITPAREKKIKALIGAYGIDEVLKTMDKIRDSRFLSTESEQGWNITLDWFIDPDNFYKVLEGQYDDGGVAKVRKENKNEWQ